MHPEYSKYQVRTWTSCTTEYRSKISDRSIPGSWNQSTVQLEHGQHQSYGSLVTAPYVLLETRQHFASAAIAVATKRKWWQLSCRWHFALCSFYLYTLMGFPRHGWQLYLADHSHVYCHHTQVRIILLRERQPLRFLYHLIYLSYQTLSLML